VSFAPLCKILQAEFIGGSTWIRYILHMQMSSVENEILDTLKTLETRIQEGKATGQPMNLMPVFQSLDKLAAQLPPGSSADLRHYMAKKSYQKARLWLEGQDPEQGACPR